MSKPIAKLVDTRIPLLSWSLLTSFQLRYGAALCQMRTRVALLPSMERLELLELLRVVFAVFRNGLTRRRKDTLSYRVVSISLTHFLATTRFCTTEII